MEWDLPRFASCNYCAYPRVCVEGEVEAVPRRVVLALLEALARVARRRHGQGVRVKALAGNVAAVHVLLKCGECSMACGSGKFQFCNCTWAFEPPMEKAMAKRTQAILGVMASSRFLRINSLALFLFRLFIWEVGYIAARTWKRTFFFVLDHDFRILAIYDNDGRPQFCVLQIESPATVCPRFIPHLFCTASCRTVWRMDAPPPWGMNENEHLLAIYLSCVRILRRWRCCILNPDHDFIAKMKVEMHDA